MIRLEYPSIHPCTTNLHLHNAYYKSINLHNASQLNYNIANRIILWCPSICHSDLGEGTQYTLLFIALRRHKMDPSGSTVLKHSRILFCCTLIPLEIRKPFIWRFPHWGCSTLISRTISCSSESLRVEYLLFMDMPCRTHSIVSQLFLLTPQ